MGNLKRIVFKKIADSPFHDDWMQYGVVYFKAGREKVTVSTTYVHDVDIHILERMLKICNHTNKEIIPTIGKDKTAPFMWTHKPWKNH